MTSDAELTVKFAILSAIAENWDKQKREDFPMILRDAIFERMFDKPLRWSVEAYLAESQPQIDNPK